MADNVPITSGAGTIIGTEDVGGGVQLQRVKLDLGGHGASIPLVGDATYGVPVNVTKVQGTVLVDSELPAASGLADSVQSTSLTTTAIGSYNYLYDATADSWSRWRGTETNGALVQVSNITTTVAVDSELPNSALLSDNTTNPNTTSVGALSHSYNGSTWDRKRSVNGVSDAGSTGLDASGTYAFNETNWDRTRNNTQGTLLNGVYSSSQIAPLQTNYNARGVILYLAISAMPASGETITPVIEMPDPVGGQNIVQLTGFPASEPGNTTGAPVAYAYIVYPGASSTGLPTFTPGSATNMVYAQSIVIPRDWRCRVIHSGSSVWEYSLGFSYVL